MGCGKYRSFPTRVVVLRAGLLAGLLGCGALLTFRASVAAGAGYLAFGTVLLLLVMATACTRCDYHGATCDNGLSRLTALLFAKRSDRARFARVGRRFVAPFLLLVAAPAGAFASVVLARPAALDVAVFGAYTLSLLAIVVTSRRLACPRCTMSGVCPLSLEASGRRRFSRDS